MKWDELLRESGYRLPSGNFTGFDHPLELHHLSLRDAVPLAKAIRESEIDLNRYLSFMDMREGKTVKNTQRWIFQLLKEPFPFQHFVFTIGKDLVGLGSTLPVSRDLSEVQLRYLVFKGYQGKGIATAMAKTMELYCFHVWGYNRIFIEMDSQNKASMKIPQKLGYQFSGTLDVSSSGTHGSGFWYSFSKQRPEDSPNAILQGREIDEYC